MRLADLIDLELACQEDRGQDAEDLRARDRQIGRKILPRLSSLVPGTRADYLDVLCEEGVTDGR